MSTQNEYPPPPRWADKFLQWYCKSELLEDLQGDLYELFYERIESQPLKYAQSRFIWEVLCSFKLSTVKRVSAFHLNIYPPMFRNYFKTAYRNILRQKGFSFINITGLAIGLASAMLIFLYIFDELTYDSIHPNAQNTYRIGHVRTFPNGESFNAPAAPGAWSTQLKEQYPEVLECVRYAWWGYPASIQNEVEDKILLSENIYWTDGSYPKVLHFKSLYGNGETAFDQPNSIALSRSMAASLFEEKNPVGKLLKVEHPALGDNSLSLIVSAIFEDYPNNSHIRPDYLVNIAAVYSAFPQLEEAMASWESGWWNSYIVTRTDADIDKLSENLNGLLEIHLAENAANYDPVFRKVTDLHFDSEFEWVNEGAGDMNYIYIFGSIAILILIIACINYMNLATARSAKRAKEIGLRKTLGGKRGQLVIQFLGESFMLSVLATVLAFGLMIIAIPLFNQVAQKSFHVSVLFQPVILLSASAIVIFVALCSGFYPALILSGFRPVEVLRGRFSTGKGSEVFRKTLVIFQFSISVVLMICTAFIMRQMNYLQDSKLSRSGDQMVSIRYGGNAPTDKYETYKQVLLQDPDISVVSMANHLPRQEYFGSIQSTFRFPSIGEDELSWSLLNVEHNFVDAFELDLIDGRTFDDRQLSDSSQIVSFLINEAGVRSLGLENEEILGLTVNQQLGEESISGQITGIVKDFPYRSMRSEIGPLLVTNRLHPIDKIVYVKLPEQKIGEKLAVLESKWKEVFPEVGFDYWFLSDEFQRMYANEDRMSELTKVFAFLALIVACLGIYGLASFLAERRNKEIGIRKVLGASIQSILLLLSKTFVLILLISSLVAIPLAYWLMNDWLQNFAYHINLSWYIFCGAIAVVFLISLFTVSYETIKAAFLNPIEYIRNE